MSGEGPLPPPPQFAIPGHHDSPPSPVVDQHPESEYAESIEEVNPEPTASSKLPRRERRRCCVAGCNNHMCLQRVPPAPTPLPVGASKARQVTHAKRLLKRQEFLERLGRSRDDTLRDLRYCVNHKMEKQSFNLTVTIKDSNGLDKETITVAVEFTVPMNVTENPALQAKRKKCCVKGCQNNYSLQRVPPLPKAIPLGSSKARQVTRAKKVFKRSVYLKRLGYDPNEVEKHPDLRFCHNHKMENKNWTFSVSIVNEQGVQVETIESTAQFEVPISVVEDEDANDAKKEAAAEEQAVEPMDAVVAGITIDALDPEQQQEESAAASASAFDPPQSDARKKEPSHPPSELVAAPAPMDANQDSLQSIML